MTSPLLTASSRPAPIQPRRPRREIAGDYPLIYAIGDIHGCFAELTALEERIGADASLSGIYDPLIVYLGDYVDRGPDSRAVLEHLSGTRHDDGLDRIALCGNHDDVFLRFLRNPRDNMGWLEFGGDATLRSYGLDILAYLDRDDGMDTLAAAMEEAIPPAHVALLENLSGFLLSGDRLFVHAGIRPGLPIAEQEDKDLMWIREPFLGQGPGLPITIIHGHTAGPEPVFGNGRICIDTRCYDTGRLTALKVTPDGHTLL